MDVSVVILTENVQDKIERCLDSVKWANEVIIVDSYSTDNTLNVCSKYTDNIYQRSLNNDFAGQINYGIGKAKHDWILRIDADEIVSDILADEIINLQNEQSFDFFYIRIVNLFWGKELKYSGYSNDYKIRLFRKDKGIYTGNIHEKLEINNVERVGTLKGHIEHYTLNSYEERIGKTNLYTNILSVEYLQNNYYWRRRFIFTKPMRTFLIGYFYKKGFMDGFEGLLWNIHRAYSDFALHVKIWEQLNMKGE